MKTFLLILLTSGIAITMQLSPVNAQQLPKHEKKTYIDSLNRFYMQASLPLYVMVSTSPESKPEHLSQTDKPNEKNMYMPMYMDGPGKHTIRHMDAHDHKEVVFTVYADDKAPESKVTYINAPYYQSTTKNFFGKGLQAVISTTDNMSGVEQTYFSVNKSEFKPYNDKIDFNTEGNYELQFAGADHVGNTEITRKSYFTVDQTAPRTFYNIVGIAQNKIISVTTRIYLTPTDSVSGVSTTYYKFDNQSEVLYKGGDLPIALLPEGDHTLTFYSVDNVKNKENETTISFFLDRTAPIMSADVLGDRFIVGDKVYYSGRTKLKLTAVDNKSGVKEILYAVDNLDFKDYTDPFYLPNKSGIHTIRYYAIDNVENLGTGKKGAGEYKHVVGIVYVDLTGPALKNIFDGPRFVKGDSVYITSNTRINLSAVDGESGLKIIRYFLDDQNKEQDYLPPLTVQNSGKHRITAVGYDNVNNRNVKGIEFIIDNEAPEIIENFSINPIKSSGGRVMQGNFTLAFSRNRT